MTDIRDFLRHTVEGYIFHDIEAMKEATARSERGGALAFPLLMTACSGIELLGALLDAERFNDSRGQDYFTRYWQNYMYRTDPNKAEAAKAVYQIARNGIAHLFMPKCDTGVVKGKPEYHLKVYDAGTFRFVIDASEVADTLKASYVASIAPILDSPIEKHQVVRMQARLAEIERYLAEPMPQITALTARSHALRSHQAPDGASGPYNLAQSSRTIPAEPSFSGGPLKSDVSSGIHRP